MRLHHETIGQGPDLLLLHGWGLHGGVWSTVAGALARTHRLHIVDLPGHGRSPSDGAWRLPEIADRLHELMPAGSVWLGWSLGALIALAAAARRPDRIRRLVLVGATPRFTTAPDWPCAVPAELLEDFERSLMRDARATITRFLSLQLGTGESERAVLRGLRAEAFRFGEPSAAALYSGLDVLRRSDLRDELSRIATPTTVIHGECDRLVPPSAASELARRLPRARRCLLARAGHAPFLSAPEAFLQSCLEASDG